MTQDNGIAKTIKIMALHILPFFALFLFAFLSIISGKSSIACEGIAVDQNNNLYIGRGDKLIVVDPSGATIRTVEVPTSRGYAFTVTEEDVIVFDTGSTVSYHDLQGDLIAGPIEGSDDRVPNGTFAQRKAYAADGTKYVLRGGLLRTSAYRISESQKELVYQIPMIDVVTKIAVYLCFALMISLTYHVIKNDVNAAGMLP